MLRRIIPILLQSGQKQSLKRLPATARSFKVQENGRKNDSSTADPEIQLGPFPTYTEKETERILNFVNAKSGEDFLNYEITKARAKKLENWKSRNGPLKSLQDILLIESFSSRIAKKFYDSLLDPPDDKEAFRKTKRARNVSFITPSIDVEEQHAIRSCVSLRIGVSSVTWSRLEMSSDPEDDSVCELTHWHHHDIPEKKLHLNDLIQRCLYLNHLIPSADCFVFEMPQTAQPNNNPGNADQQNINIQKAQITAVLGYALRARPIVEQQMHLESTETSDSTKKLRSNVFYLKRFLTARLFNNLVGAERVSSEQTILAMMRTYYNKADGDEYFHTEDDDAKVSSACRRGSLSGNVQFPADLRHMFSKSERYHREFLGQALLLNLAFVRLVLLQDAESIALVTRNPNHMKPTDMPTAQTGGI